MSTRSMTKRKEVVRDLIGELTDLICLTESEEKDARTSSLENKNDQYSEEELSAENSRCEHDKSEVASANSWQNKKRGDCVEDRRYEKHSTHDSDWNEGNSTHDNDWNDDSLQYNENDDPDKSHNENSLQYSDDPDEDMACSAVQKSQLYKEDDHYSYETSSDESSSVASVRIFSPSDNSNDSVTTIDLSDSDEMNTENVIEKKGKKRHHSLNKSCNNDDHSSNKRINSSNSYPAYNESYSVASSYPPYNHDSYSVDPIQNNSMMYQYNNSFNFSHYNDNSVDPSQNNSMVSQYNPGCPTDANLSSADLSTYMNSSNFPSCDPILQTNAPTSMVFESCTMVPPLPNAPTPSRQERPNGCKTVFVGGLPEKITEAILREVFSICGEIIDLRMSEQQNCCHIRFSSESSVDAALSFSGYHIRIEHKYERGYFSFLHVDFAITREDRQEYEQRLQQNVCPPSPPPIVKFSFKKAKKIVNKLRGEKAEFEDACRVIVKWMEKGSCNWNNGPTFFSLLQSLDSNVHRFESELSKQNIEIQQAKEKYSQISNANGKLFDAAEKVLQCASTKRVMDCFTKPQRVKLDLWKKKVSMVKHSIMVESRIEADMELSDEECHEEEDINKLRDQLQVCEKRLEELEKVNNMMQLNYLETKRKLEDAEKESSVNRANSEGLLVTSHGESISDIEARLITLISTFLLIHPLGASIDYICSYLETMQSNINTRTIENMMRKFTSIFKEESTGIGANLVKKMEIFKFEVLGR